MLSFILIVFLAIIVGLLIYLLLQEGRYSVRRTQLINADIDTVFDKIRDFKSWRDWSPWLIHEPETKLEYSENFSEEGGYYSWDGKRIGAGKLTHVKLERPHRIEQKIEFYRPFKSVCEVGFEFAEEQGQTRVAWIMQGKMPFLLRFMTQKTRDMIEKDYDLGLAMLNGQLNDHAEYPVLKFEGETVLDPVQSLCKGFSGGLEAMEEAMKKGFPELMEFIEQHNGNAAGAPFSAYHKVDIKTMQFVCDMAIPVEGGMEAGEYQLKKLGGGRFFKVTVKGNYQFLELAWYSANAHVQMIKLKYDKSRASLEVYENDPEKVGSSNEIITTLYVPIK